MHILQFTDASAVDARLSGGKGASLLRLLAAGFPVPPGFVISAAAFEQFLTEVGLAGKIETLLGEVRYREMQSVNNASEQIRQAILAASIPGDIADEIQSAFDALGATNVAVRSSATVEDGVKASWAGELDTFLNTTKETLLEHVKLCWASLFTARAIFYRFEHTLGASPVSVAVVVQKMVQSEASGVAFSVHPVTEDPSQLIIEATKGLGDELVSGAITPDSYVVEKRDVLSIDSFISVPGQVQVLSAEQIRQLSQTILAIEKHFGFPVDVEWAFEKNVFYILQARPITTLG